VELERDGLLGERAERGGAQCGGDAGLKYGSALDHDRASMLEKMAR
jgi:hypothetical protein